MAGRFVRSSKYRKGDLHFRRFVCPDHLPGHVFGRPTRKEQCYDNLRISKNAWDTNLVKVRCSYAKWETTIDGGKRPIQNILQSIGKQAEEGLLL